MPNSKREKVFIFSKIIRIVSVGKGTKTCVSMKTQIKQADGKRTVEHQF